MARASAISERVRLESLFDSSSDPIAFYDREGRFLSINRAFEKLVGYSRRELFGRSFLEVTPREYHPECRRVLRRLRKTGRPGIFEKEYRRRDGGLVPVRVTGFVLRDGARRVLGFASIARDVTTLRRSIFSAEASLRDALSLSEAALESTADGLLIIDRAGRISGFNRRFLAMWRIPRRLAATGADSVLLGYVLKQLKRPEAFLARVKQLYARPREESFDFIEFKDGTVFERYSRPQLLGHRVAGRVWSFRDVTAARKLERALAELSSREQARIGRELHDSVGQTLTAISLLAKPNGKPAVGAQALRRIAALSRDGVKRVRLIARTLLPPDLEAGDLTGALRALGSNAHDLFGMRCEVSIEGSIPAVDPAFATELYRIAQEAVYNAAKHSKGTLVRMRLKSAGRRLNLTVSDDGIGLSARRAGKDRGLGLGIMRQRAAHLGAALEIDSGVSGTTVRCVCPLGGQTPA